MNAFNEMILRTDRRGYTESCDQCNALIHNWDWMKMSFVAEDGKRILCFQCWDNERREQLIASVFATV